MVKKLSILIVSIAFISELWAQDFAPGYIDPMPILKAAAETIGTDKLKCVSISGTVETGMVGQQFLQAYNTDWPKGKPLNNYTRTMNWETGTMKETFDREPGHNPASWKYGSGWKGGTPIQQQRRQSFMVNGKYAWHRDGDNGKPVPASPEDAERWQLDLWINPHGFLKAAMMPGANPKATWRWELLEMGLDGVTTRPEKVFIVSITVLGKYQVDATINSKNLVQRIHTRVPDPVLGDMNYEHEFSNHEYADLGEGIKFPTFWHHHEGWDDNFQSQSITCGHNCYDGDLATIKPNVCNDPVIVPESVRQAKFAVQVDTQKLGDGVWLMGGASHNSVAVEFKDYIVVVEAPLDEERNLAVIDEIVKLIPNKPIRFLVNTHQHHDHIGGLRTYMHLGTTIITHWRNYDFYTRDVLNYAPRALKPDMVSLWPPTELAEGYWYETVRENYVLSDGERNMHISYVNPLYKPEDLMAHVEGMLIAYLPGEKMLIEADLFNPPAKEESLPSTPRRSAANRSLYEHVQRLGLEVETIVPIHGSPVPWSDFLAVIERDSSAR